MTTPSDSSPSRTPPKNIDAEIALLGALLSNNNALENVSDYLRSEHFSEAAHAKIYAAIVKLVGRGQLADAVTLAYYFQNDDLLEEVGGANYLTELQANVISIINAGDYGRVIYDLARRRDLIALGEDLVNDSFSDDLDSEADTLIENTEQKLFYLAEQGQSSKGFITFAEAMREAIELAEIAHKRDGSLSGLPTHLVRLDKLLGGMHHSDLIILAGRPSMGKTALATNIGFNAARRSDAKVAFFSLEMSADQLATRMLSEQANVSSASIRRGELDGERFNRLMNAARDLEDIDYFIDDTPALTIGTLRSRARRLKRQHGLNLIIVDYLQLMRGSANHNESRVQELSEITRGLKMIAKELNVPVVALSQLSRAVENRDDKRPQLADLRESGTIEQDADVVMFVYREEYYILKAEPLQKAEESEEKFASRYANWQQRAQDVMGKAKVIVAKQRHGPTGDVDLAFNGEFTRFDNLAEDGTIPESY